MAGFAPEVLALLQSVGLAGPMAIGEKFFVNGGADAVTTGVDAVGRGSKARPFRSIAYALTNCVSGRHDYIYCWNLYQQDTYPIDIVTTHVHIIGLAMPGGGPNLMVPTLDTAIFNLPLVGGGISNVEIAGFNLGGGATHGCIELQGANNMLWVHHCTFGHLWAGTPQDGIWIIGMSNSQSILIENCHFLPGLTQFGISAPAATAHLSQGIIRNNRFIRIPGGAISLEGDCDQMVIEDNRIGVAADAVELAIALGAFCAACLVAHNEANHGDAAMTNNPYHDGALADVNDWMCNQVGSVMKYPDEAM